MHLEILYDSWSFNWLRSTVKTRIRLSSWRSMYPFITQNERRQCDSVMKEWISFGRSLVRVWLVLMRDKHPHLFLCPRVRPSFSASWLLWIQLEPAPSPSKASSISWPGKVPIPIPPSKLSNPSASSPETRSVKKQVRARTVARKCTIGGLYLCAGGLTS